MGRRNCEEKHVLAWKVDSFLGCIRQSVARGSREEIPLCQYMVRHILSSLSNAGLPSSKETLGIVKLVWRKTMKMIKGLEHLEYREAMRAETVELGEEKVQGTFIIMYKYLMRQNKEDTARFFSVVLSESKRGNRHILKCVEFHLNTINFLYSFFTLTFFTLRNDQAQAHAAQRGCGVMH